MPPNCSPNQKPPCIRRAVLSSVYILFDDHEEIAGFDALTSLDMDLTHDTIHRRGDGGFHLHRFGDDDGVALLDRGAFFDEEFYNGAGECRTDFARYVLVRFSGGIRRLCT